MADLSIQIRDVEGVAVMLPEGFVNARIDTALHKVPDLIFGRHRIKNIFLILQRKVERISN